MSPQNFLERVNRYGVSGFYREWKRLPFLHEKRRQINVKKNLKRSYMPVRVLVISVRLFSLICPLEVKSCVFRIVPSALNRIVNKLSISRCFLVRLVNSVVIRNHSNFIIGDSVNRVMFSVNDLHHVNFFFVGK